MKEVSLNAYVPSQSAEQVYAAISNFSLYPQLCESVRNIEIESIDDNQVLSNWEVNFHSGILKWQERDVFDPANLHIHFRQTAGDIDHFSGYWQVSEAPEGASIAFHSCFDLGMPMLADMLDPVARQAIRDNISAIINGLFPNSQIKD
ncbi:SRPBCC family protein [Pseudomonas entomophila]|uniref:type II toxin-antitoxin system RatA family toxin n=1 Tax=Pseudomonas TaxID=286 RepID=UPI001BD17704|nr:MULTISPECIES: SRPBCC family protein [Pseudomonas]MCG8296409.1 SRPBCC family protein [Pseudomonas entomophila]MDF9619317.1 SRPBCC family protein [Pseudomonas entomophila]QVM92721.1 SRPBCC family protein [Pseudomonas entomophila]